MGIFASTFSALLLLQALSASPTEHDGVITAKVLDQSGNPVAGATVWMQPVGGKPQARAVPECLTDDTGICSRGHLSLGEYRVTAMKEAAGYPNPTFDLYGHNQKQLIVKISPDALEVSAHITLGPKAASLTVNVTDIVTGKPVKNPTIILRRAADPTDFVSVGPNSESKVLIPAGEDVLVEVLAEGYNGWRLDLQQDLTQSKTLNLRSDEWKELAIRLQPR